VETTLSGFFSFYSVVAVTTADYLAATDVAVAVTMAVAATGAATTAVNG